MGRQQSRPATTRGRSIVRCAMEDRHQASPARALIGRFTRRTAVRNLLGLTAAASLTAGATTRVAAQQSTPDGTIQQFNLAIATYQYAAAYALLGSQLQAKQTLA